MIKLTEILIVEDEMIIAANISMQLSNLGYDVIGIIPRAEEVLNFIQILLCSSTLSTNWLINKLLKEYLSHQAFSFTNPSITFW